MAADTVAIRKQTQINKAGRTMFIWIALASVLVGVAAVVCLFLGQKIIYTEKVLATKQSTVSTLDHNLSVVDSLKEDVRALDANSALMSVRANDSDQALQVVLDALPSEANSLAVGASLQNKLLSGVSGNYRIDSLQVDSVNGVESLLNSTTVDASSDSSNNNVINFNFSIIGDQSALKDVLHNLERSIRAIVVKNLNIETNGGQVTLTVNGQMFYQPAKNIQLVEKAVEVK